jgi:two-component system, response regulator PdtaR
MTISTSSRLVVLVVEDDFLLRTNAAEMVADAGFDVVEAGNADEAIAILEARPDVHVAFTDIQMAGSMDGLKLAHIVRGRWPPIKIIATSGNHVFKDSDLPEGGVFLPKPYSFDSISAVLREMAG